MNLATIPTTVRRPGDVGDLIDACAELRAELREADERNRLLDDEIREADNAFEALACAAARLLHDLAVRGGETASHPESFWALADIVGWPDVGPTAASGTGGAA